MTNLKKYNDKRNFTKTREPKGKIVKTKKKTLKYVIQHHLARKDHYDLRLEYNGVFVSFAVPKGPSFDPKDKRLAVKVEDHPLSYGNFEGTIPKGEYGAGTVMLFDTGTWKPIKDTKVNFKKGPIKFYIKGKRLQGAWALVPFKDDNYLLIKEKDEFVNKNNINKYKTSIKTGRTMKEISENAPEDIELTSPDKIIFKNGKVTKKDIYDYYKKVSKYMMPYLDNRLISTVRRPDGKDNFFMKHLNNDSKNLGIKKIRNKEDENSDYYYFKNATGLLEEVQMNSFEFHIWGAKQNKINNPDILVFDLDPDEGLSLAKVRRGVKDLKQILDKLKLTSYLKTSGGKGYHIYVPINSVSWHKLEKIAKDVANILVESYPDRYTINMRKENRKGKIFIDFFRNKKGATSVCPYSLRLKDKATVSLPIKWSELDKINPDGITIKNIDKYLKRKDPWANFFS